MLVDYRRKDEQMQEYMRLKNPMQVRIFFTKQKGWYTIAEMAEGLGISRDKVTRALRGGSITTATAQVIADVIHEEMMAIVEYAQY